jgi:hypothetical protein
MLSKMETTFVCLSGKWSDLLGHVVPVDGEHFAGDVVVLPHLLQRLGVLRSDRAELRMTALARRCGRWRSPRVGSNTARCSLANSGPTRSESIGGNDGNKLLVLHRHLQGTGCLPPGCDRRIMAARSLKRFQ